MATETKPKNIIPSPEDVKLRIKDIIQALAEGNSFNFNLLMQQLSNWSVAKRKQAFRGILKSLLSGSNSSITAVMSAISRPQGIQIWEIDAGVWQSRMLMTFVEKIKSMDKNNRFSPEKVLTISKIANTALILNHDSLEYLVRKNILVISRVFVQSTISANIAYNISCDIRTAAHKGQHMSKLMDLAGLDTNILSYDVRVYKEHLNILNNMDLFFGECLKYNTEDTLSVTTKSGLLNILSSLNSLYQNLYKDTEITDGRWGLDQIRKNVTAVQRVRPEVIALDAEEAKQNIDYILGEINIRLARYTKLLLGHTPTSEPVSALVEQGHIL